MDIKMEMSDECAEIFSAVSSLQGEISQPSLDGNVKMKFKTGGGVSYGYATLGEVQRCLREPMKKNGLGVIQFEEFINEKFFLVTLIVHKSGQWIKGFSPMICTNPNDPKIFGAAKTYARRYSLYGLFNLYGQEDIDAQEVNTDNTENLSVKTSCSKKQEETIKKLIFQRGAVENDVLKSYSKKLGRPAEDWFDFSSHEAGKIIEELIKKMQTKKEVSSCSKIQANG